MEMAIGIHSSLSVTPNPTSMLTAPTALLPNQLLARALSTIPRLSTPNSRSARFLSTSVQCSVSQATESITSQKSGLMRRSDIRNIAIVAHVDHGKATLVESMLKQAKERIMESIDLERERGTRIMSRNTSVTYKNTKINMIDTPGHLDFGAEVEGILKMVEGVLLVVDSFEGPMPQTRFVLEKALEFGHAVVVVVNEIDRPSARPDYVINSTLELFIELNATEEQCDFQVIYASSINGKAGLSPGQLADVLGPLFESLIRCIPGPRIDKDGDLKMLATKIEYEEHKGITAVGRLHSGVLKTGMDVQVCTVDDTCGYARVSELFVYENLYRVPVESVEAGDICTICGISDIQDIMIRYQRMRGRPTLWLPGTDHAGIATQLVVERMLASEGIKRADLSRDEFIARVWEWKEKYGGTITNQIKRLGASCDWTREHFTLDEQLSRAVIEAFVSLHEKGLIYQGSYMVNWSPNLQTAVSDLEVEYSEEPGFLYHIKYRVAGGSRDDFLTVATTRPETLFGDTAIAVNPEDDRYAKYIGRQAIVPMTFGRHIPIICDKLVDKDFGTGVLKISPGHDHNDYLLARKTGLPILNVMNKDGTLNEVAGMYCGLDRFEARKKLWSDLEESGLAGKKEPYTMRVPRSQRGGEIIEPLVSKQWFLTMESLAEKGLRAVETGELTIMPERFEKIYNHWLSNIKDWCISRQLWWGHRIPVWYIEGKDCEEEYIVARSPEEAKLKALDKYGKSAVIYQDPDVLDTWFSSALWPFSTLGWPDVSTEDFKRFYPTTMLETGHDILFFWVARMIMMGIEFTGKVPFKYVYLHGLIRDSQGRKMSKTLGNVIDPLDTIKEYGTDALRFSLSVGTPGQDLNLSNERLASNKAFTNKLWNAGKFLLQNLPAQSDISAWENIQSYKFDSEDLLLRLPLPECWVISKLHLLVDSVTTNYEKYYLGDVARETYDFFWGDFADWYVEASKARLYQNADPSISNMSQAVLLYVFENVLKLLHPFMPFVTEALWQALPNRKEEALVISPWPQTSLPANSNSIRKFENLQALTRAIRNARAEYSVEPAKRISATVVASSEVVEYIYKEKEVLALLSRLDLQGTRFMESPPDDAKQSVHLVAGEGLEAYLPLADMVDISAEVERLAKRLSKMEAEYQALVARLSSPKFVEKAPEEVVNGVREKAVELEEKINLTKTRLTLLESNALVADTA